MLGGWTSVNEVVSNNELSSKNTISRAAGIATRETVYNRSKRCSIRRATKNVNPEAITIVIVV